jgi:hypothetical protein
VDGCGGWGRGVGRKERDGVDADAAAEGRTGGVEWDWRCLGRLLGGNWIGIEMWCWGVGFKRWGERLGIGNLFFLGGCGGSCDMRFGEEVEAELVLKGDLSSLFGRKERKKRFREDMKKRERDITSYDNMCFCNNDSDELSEEIECSICSVE